MTTQEKAAAMKLKSAQKFPAIEYVEPEYLSHDAPGAECRVTEGGLLASDEEGGDVYWIVEAEIEPDEGERLALCWNAHDALVEALRAAREKIIAYYIDTNGRYPGGPIYADLAKQIDSALKLAGASNE